MKFVHDESSSAYIVFNRLDPTGERKRDIWGVEFDYDVNDLLSPLFRGWSSRFVPQFWSYMNKVWET